MPSGLTLKSLIVGFRPDLPKDQPAPFVYLAIINGGPPEWTDEELKKGSEDYKKSAGAALKDHSFEVVKIDRLVSLKVSSELLVKDPGGSITMKGVQAFIPGRFKSYIITGVWPMANFPEAGETIASMIEGFRVLKRPLLPRYYMGGK